MTWTSKSKNLRVHSVIPHTEPPSGAVKGRAPNVLAMSFSPQELYGAMARCSHLHTVNPDAVTFESEGCRHLISQHVDDTAENFFILESAKRLKDFSRTHMVGVVGAGLAYLQMVRDGYVWCDHFEKLSLAGSAPTKKSPDFVFSRPGNDDVAITESKATSGTQRKSFQARVTRGYQEQVAPFLGMKVGGSLASHGYSIGSWMTSATRAELLIDHTAIPETPSPSHDPGSPIDIRRGNYLTALSLMFGPLIASAIKAGSWPESDIGLLTTTWLGREWLLGFPAPHLGTRFWGGENKKLSENIDWTSWPLINEFALDLEVAEAVFKSFSGLDTSYDPLTEIEVMNEDLMARARMAGGAIFPDGLAVIGKPELIGPSKVSYWNPQTTQFGERTHLTRQEQTGDAQFSAARPDQSWLLEERTEVTKPAMLQLRSK